ncbi:helix-turn-helix domain-containing protein [Niastella caeni]|uniref:helix-turn-helix domain-containing protein n=1 Tax=Niastella caeni TaxID=2569763 RepID=UPI0014099E79|nr:AraC family transcriptional regulator [Niastella caeni]
MNCEERFSIYVLKATVEIKEYIDRHPLAWITVNEHAVRQRVNRKDLQKCFKQQYGKKISEYQKLKRIDAACEMLLAAKMTKKEIAALCGYSNQNNFSNAFKKVKNMSPQAWQKKYGTS